MLSLHATARHSQRASQALQQAARLLADAGFQVTTAATRHPTPPHQPTALAVQQVTGLPPAMLQAHTRAKLYVYARLLYTYIRHHHHQADTLTIANEIDHTTGLVEHYLARFQDEYRYNRDFRTLAQAVHIPPAPHRKPSTAQAATAQAATAPTKTAKHHDTNQQLELFANN